MGEELETRVGKYWPRRHELAMMSGIAMKGKCIIVPNLLQRQILEQLYANHMGIEKTCLLIRESAYYINMNADIEQIAK